MKILALDTGGLVTPDAATIVAMRWDDGDEVSILALETIVEPRKLGALLAGRLEDAIEKAGWEWEEVNGLVVGIGPGSWTSLRVGVATMKTLAQTLGIPLAGIPSFDALAAAAHRALTEHELEAQTGKSRKKRQSEPAVGSQILLTLAPCRPGELYGKIFLRTPHYVAGAQKEWIASAKTHTDAAYSQALSDDIDAPVILCGAGSDEASTYLTSRDEAHTVVDVDTMQVAIELALTGAFQISTEETGPLEDIVPLYLAPSSAERNRDELLATR
ncbi:tRNA (adenosine(37)-N6)-threonylcarbamoyltransferase complex dimerization subunit type 1 TsaB [bacterium]|nr:MAG: tRNA (adenosine(37)-N6)-threonylcarbamoyltransferase complex dimerization subunit type 1 TsaB [bacterium]